MSAKKKKQKPYWEMTTEELAEAMKEYDQEFIGDTFRDPPPPEAVAQLERAKRKIGRPKVGEGAARVLVTVERRLLSRADEFAMKSGMSRSEMIAQGLRLLMAKGGSGNGSSKGQGRSTPEQTRRPPSRRTKGRIP